MTPKAAGWFIVSLIAIAVIVFSDLDKPNRTIVAFALFISACMVGRLQEKAGK